MTKLSPPIVPRAIAAVSEVESADEEESAAFIAAPFPIVGDTEGAVVQLSTVVDDDSTVWEDDSTVWEDGSTVWEDDSTVREDESV